MRSRTEWLREAATRLRDTAPALEPEWALLADPVAAWLDRHADMCDRLNPEFDSPLTDPSHPAWRVAAKVMGRVGEAERTEKMLERTLNLASAYQRYEATCKLHGTEPPTRQEIISILRTSASARSNFLHGVSTGFLLFAFKNGDETSWDEEFEWIRENNADNLRGVRSLVKEGKLPPVEVCFREMRIIDGHHRILAHKELDYAIIPISDAWDKE